VKIRFNRGVSAESGNRLMVQENRWGRVTKMIFLEYVQSKSSCCLANCRLPNSSANTGVAKKTNSTKKSGAHISKRWWMIVEMDRMQWLEYGCFEVQTLHMFNLY
jgi:hypothetical protein